MKNNKVTPNMFRFGVVILNYINYELTISCVNKLKAIDESIKIIIVDNNSCNDSYIILSKEYCNETSVTVLESKQNKGYATGNNIGLRYLVDNHPDIQYLCVMNPDVVIESYDVFLTLSKYLYADLKLAAISPIMNLNGEINEEDCAWSIPNNFEMFMRHFVLAKEKSRKGMIPAKGVFICEAIPGSFFMIKKEVLERIGFLDEGTFLYNEENILGIRIKEIGMTCGLCTECQFMHYHILDKRRKTLRQVLRAYSAGNQSRLYMSKKYYSIWVYIMVAIVSGINYPIIICRHILGDLKYRIKGTKH